MAARVTADAPASHAAPALPQGAHLYFAATPRPDPATRLLLISYYFPPDPSVGGLRWQQMARHLAEKGWVLDVVTRDFGNVDDPDHQRLDALPPGTRVFSVPDREPLVGRVQRRLWPLVRHVLPATRPRDRLDTLTRHELDRQGGTRALVRAHLAWLEYARDGNWARAAADVSLALAPGAAYGAVITSGPPHMAHEAGRLVATRIRRPLVVDMRDPWSFVPRLVEAVASPVWTRFAARYERHVVHHASLVAMNTEPSRDAMRERYPEAAPRIVAIRNGCDDEPLPVVPKEPRFSIRFAGSVYADRDPRPVFRAAARVIRDRGLGPAELAIEFIGKSEQFAGVPTMGIAREEGIADYVRVGGRQPRDAALAFMAGATMLLSLPQDSAYAVPAKIYEYMRFEAWLLVLAPAASAIGQILHGSGADVVDPADIDGITAVLRRRLTQFERGERPTAVAWGGQFDRRVQSQRLMEHLVRLGARPYGDAR